MPRGLLALVTALLLLGLLALGSSPAAGAARKPPKADEPAQATCMLVASLDRTQLPEPEEVSALLETLDQSASKGAARQARKLRKAGDSVVEQFNAISSGVGFWCKHKLLLECSPARCKGGRRVQTI